MTIRFTVDAPARLVRATVPGPRNPTLDEFRGFLDALAAHPDFQPGFDVVYDRRAVTHPPDDAYVRAATAAVEARVGQLGGCRWAVVIGQQPALEVVRGSRPGRSSPRTTPWRGSDATPARRERNAQSGPQPEADGPNTTVRTGFRGGRRGRGLNEEGHETTLRLAVTAVGMESGHRRRRR